MKYKRWTEEDFAELARLNALGYTAKEIGAAMDRSDEQIKSYKVKLGLSKRSNNNRTDLSVYLPKLEELHVEAIDVKTVKGSSTFKCTKCNNTWVARLFDVAERKQACVSCSNTGKSKIATEWLDKVEITNREFQIPGTKYRVDGVQGNTVYEFLGDYWHGNPDLFEADAMNTRVGRTFGELFEETVQRLYEIQSLGYTVVYIWENDYINGKGQETLS